MGRGVGGCWRRSQAGCCSWGNGGGRIGWCGCDRWSQRWGERRDLNQNRNLTGNCLHSTYRDRGPETREALLNPGNQKPYCQRAGYDRSSDQDKAEPVVPQGFPASGADLQAPAANIATMAAASLAGPPLRLAAVGADELPGHGVGATTATLAQRMTSSLGFELASGRQAIPWPDGPRIGRSCITQRYSPTRI
jgi:hypothetical protein